MTRLGLWGEGTLFPGEPATGGPAVTPFEQFHKAASRGAAAVLSDEEVSRLNNRI